MKKPILILLIFLILVFSFWTIISNSFCFDSTHRGIYPVNPYCTRCRGRDGIVQHECTNPDGREIYCRSCGKIVFENILSKDS